MNESQMLLIKSTVEEAGKYPNRAHKDAVKELTQIVCERLRIQYPAGDEIKFLQTIINDYIVLTR